jgi:1-acyl-sn-glycerol-3-phosphate acyltransferase
MIKQSYRAIRLLLHILLGVVMLVLTGSLWNNSTTLVKTCKRWWLQRATRLLGITVELSGQVPTPKDGKGILFVSNHVSWIDIPLIGGLSKLNFLSKAEVRNWPLIGRLATGTGTLFIQRGSGDTDQVAMSIADYLQEGRSVLFFPEGTTSDGTAVRKFHKKLFQSARHTEIEVCPIAIHYHVHNSSTNPVPFIGDDEFTGHLWNLLSHRNIIASVEFLPLRPVDSDNLEEFVRTLQKEVANSVSQHHARWQTSAAKTCLT